jgi:protein O-GlcNAc transferase
MNDPRIANALALRRAGKFAEAAQMYGEILQSDPANFDALHALGIICYQAGRLEEAERLIADAVAARPFAPDALYNRACLLQKLNRPDEALVSFDTAIAVKPDYMEALVNRGTLLARLGRPGDALASFDRVVALRPDIAEVWSNRAGALLTLRRFEEAIESANRALGLKPAYADAWKICGNALGGVRRFDEAYTAFEKACALAPNDAESWHKRGSVLQQLGRLGEAQASFDRALALAPENLAARSDRADFFFGAEHFEEAAADYAKILGSDPNCPSHVRGYLTICRLHICDWRGLADERAAIAAGIHGGLFVLDPVGNAVMSSSAADQYDCARTWAMEKFPAQGAAHWQGPKYSHDRIRIAYVSADYRAHAVAFLVAGIFEHHDRTRFEVTGVSYGTDDGSAMRRRMEGAFDRFIDIRGMNDTEVADMLKHMEIDIAVDLSGYTGISRTGVFARRAAPLQVNYLGYPGTMGADYMDYVIGDPTVIPPEDWPYYSEKIVWLPRQYQANDRKRRVAERTPSREEVGLPARGFVFCCFNNNHKISPEMFDIWMRLLTQVEGSVLWLFQDNPTAARNLRREAEIRGVAAGRLVFAPRALPEDHLARQRLADLFLDTLPYNAHTTASDAIWVGLPLVTTPGKTFAARVAASLLKAAGLPELVAPTLADYEALALNLARDTSALAAIKAKLVRNRDSCALFDTASITRQLEAAFVRMHERRLAGEPPMSFAVAPPESGDP